MEDGSANYAGAVICPYILYISPAIEPVQEILARHALQCGISGIHMYPLGGFRRSASWIYAVTDVLFTLDDKGGFKVG